MPAVLPSLPDHLWFSALRRLSRGEAVEEASASGGEAQDHLRSHPLPPHQGQNSRNPHHHFLNPWMPSQKTARQGCRPSTRSFTCLPRAPPGLPSWHQDGGPAQPVQHGLILPPLPPIWCQHPDLCRSVPHRQIPLSQWGPQIRGPLWLIGRKVPPGPLRMCLWPTWQASWLR